MGSHEIGPGGLRGPVRVFHAGEEEIRKPDVFHGRKNADFGQGFYLSPQEAFVRRWAHEGKDGRAVFNVYELETEGLQVRRLNRDAEWFDVIDDNRHMRGDRFRDWDVVVGPIANDTIYDVMGITTSGLLRRDQSLALLLEGPAYEQIVLKSPRAAQQLRFLGSEVLSREEIETYRATVHEEEKAYQEVFARTLERVLEAEG